ncbi:hypothetical protein OAS39_04715 [Pirellulales bacterium]|nr:hypothetical protein [Pirellulales bacterium]
MYHLDDSAVKPSEVLYLSDFKDKMRPVARAVVRHEFATMLGNRRTKVMPHEDIIRKLDEGDKLFNVLVQKTEMAIPYTSVFIELDSGYWTPEKEKELRELIKTQEGN